MAFSNIDSLSLGKILHIVFDNEIYVQPSEEYRDFEILQSKKIDVAPAREYRYYLQSSLGPAAVAFANPGTTNRSFPTAQQVSASEVTAKMKELEATIEIEHNLWRRAMESADARYAEPLEVEIRAKTAMLKRRLAVALYGDGSGILGTIASTTGSTTQVVTLQSGDTNLGHAGLFEIDDKVNHFDSDGTTGDTVTVSAGTFDYWRVVSVDRDNNKITLQAVNTAGADVNATSWTPDAGDYFIKDSQATKPDITSALSDYGTATEEIAGLESFGNDDGRTIFGVAHSGALAASRYDAGGSPIDSKHIQRALSRAKTNVGQKYKYAKMLMAPETLDALIDSREADRRFIAVADKARGIEGAFQYLHLNDRVEAVASEFCWPKRIYMIPEQRDGSKILEFAGTEFKSVKGPGGQDFFLKPASSGGGFVNMVTGYMQGAGVIVCKHPRGIAVVHNFTNS